MSRTRYCVECPAGFAANLRRIPGASKPDTCPCGGRLTSEPTELMREAVQLRRQARELREQRNDLADDCQLQRAANASLRNTVAKLRGELAFMAANLATHALVDEGMSPHMHATLERLKCRVERALQRKPQPARASLRLVTDNAKPRDEMAVWPPDMEGA